MQVTKSSSYVEKSVFKSGKAESFIGRTFKTLCKNTGKIDKGSRSFTIVTGYTITMLSRGLLRFVPIRKGISQIESVTIEKEVEDLLSNGVITSVLNQEGYRLLSILFLFTKMNRSQRPVIYLKHLNQFIPYQHFKTAVCTGFT